MNECWNVWPRSALEPSLAPCVLALRVKTHNGSKCSVAARLVPVSKGSSRSPLRPGLFYKRTLSTPAKSCQESFLQPLLTYTLAKSAIAKP